MALELDASILLCPTFGRNVWNTHNIYRDGKKFGNGKTSWKIMTMGENVKYKGFRKSNGLSCDYIDMNGNPLLNFEGS